MYSKEVRTELRCANGNISVESFLSTCRARETETHGEGRALDETLDGKSQPSCRHCEDPYEARTLPLTAYAPNSMFNEITGTQFRVED